MMDFIKNTKNFILHILFPTRCPYCNSVINPEDYACEECKKKFPKTDIIKYAYGGYKCCSPFPYNDIFASAVKNFKFHNLGGNAKQLAFVMVQSIIQSYNISDFDIITCVPMHKRMIKQRGYNQAELLAKECAEILGIPFVQTLEKYKENTAQHSIKASLRADNVRGVYRLVNKNIAKGKNILIIDDIITTGHTLGECAKILTKGKCKSVNCAVLCSVVIS